MNFWRALRYRGLGFGFFGRFMNGPGFPACRGFFPSGAHGSCGFGWVALVFIRCERSAVGNCICGSRFSARGNSDSAPGFS